MWVLLVVELNDADVVLCMQLIRYFTCGPDEVRAWTIRRGTKAPQAAGVIQFVLFACLVI